MNHVEEAIAIRIAKLYPAVFAELGAFCNRHGGFTSEVVTRFDREIQFYLAYLEFVRRVRGAGLSMCYPTIGDSTTPVQAVDAFDAALADKLISDGRPVVSNDISLSGQERIWVVTGPNQGGKTTYARMIGQLHHLAGLGLLVPGTRARLPLPDRIFTHFERGENLHDRQARRRPGPHPRHPASRHSGQPADHQRNLHLHRTAGCGLARHKSAASGNRYGLPVRLR
jgi:DNA mismatch repair protein MutS